ncbi:MAG: heimdallarchaeosortase [Candidatus Thorarchaeota archaeon]
MSQVSWYPQNPRSRRDFFLRSFPIFIALVIFLYFGLDWLGAFEFLEKLVRENAAWLMKVIFGVGYDEFIQGYYERIDADPLSGGSIRFGETFPGIRIHGYPSILLIIRACTGMEAGALLMALILITPAKWYNKILANVVNLLMMHIGNTFRVAFHFWFTKYLYEGGMSADKAFFWAHDMLSKVFGFVGIVIFTLVIERTGVKIVSTFGAWMDAIGEGVKRFYWRVQKFSFYKRPLIANENENPNVDLEIEKGSIEKSRTQKVFFYPKEEIVENKWSFFKNTFSVFVIIAAIIMVLNFIPQITKMIGGATDTIAINWFGAERIEFAMGRFWWYSKFENVANVPFAIGIFASGLGFVALMLGLIFATPADMKKKIFTSLGTLVTIIPLQILQLGLRKGMVWQVANNTTFKSEHPLLYLNVADLANTWFPIFFWTIIIIAWFVILYYLDVKVISTLFAWLHQLYDVFLRLVGLKKGPKDDEVFSDEANIDENGEVILN